MSQKSTIEYYHMRKNALMRSIINTDSPIKINHDQQPFCQNCRRAKDSVNELHIEHPNNNGNSKKAEGGWQKLYKYEKHHAADYKLYVVCEECHYLMHKRRATNTQRS